MRTLHEAERELLCEALRLTNYNVKQAAERLGVARQTAADMMDRHGIDRDPPQPVVHWILTTRSGGIMLKIGTQKAAGTIELTNLMTDPPESITMWVKTLEGILKRGDMILTTMPISSVHTMPVGLTEVMAGV